MSALPPASMTTILIGTGQLELETLAQAARGGVPFEPAGDIETLRAMVREAGIRRAAESVTGALS